MASVYENSSRIWLLVRKLPTVLLVRIMDLAGSRFQPNRLSSTRSLNWVRPKKSLEVLRGWSHTSATKTYTVPYYIRTYHRFRSCFSLPLGEKHISTDRNYNIFV